MKKLTESVQLKTILVGLLVLLAVTLIPLFMIAHYNFISVDDFTFTLNSGKIWEETGSVWRVLLGQVEYTKDFYYEWQGTYFGVWAFTSAMGIFAEDAYYMVTYITLGGFVLAELFGLMVIMVRCLGADRIRAGIVAISCVVLQVLLTPVPVEGFFWFCGSMLYTFLYALAWLLISLLLLMASKRERPLWKLISMEVGIVLLLFAVGGGNYVVALSVLLFLLFYNVWMVVQKHPQRYMSLGNMLWYIAAFIVNVAAPGNQVRQAASGVTHMSFFGAIWRSLVEAFRYICNNAIPPCIILGCMLVPIFRGIIKKRSFKYPWPLLVILISFGVFAAQFTPTLYALQITGAGRIQNLYRFNYYIWLYANEFYLLGWLHRKLQESGKTYKWWQRVDGSTVGRKSFVLTGWLVGGVALLITLYFWGGDKITTVSAVMDLHYGNAQQYQMEFRERLAVLEDETLPEVELKPFRIKPYLLYFGDLQKDPEDWVNKAMAEYYGKEKVTLAEE